MTSPNNEPLIDALRKRALDGAKAAELLRYLALECGITQQVVWMELFRDAFGVGLGNVTAIGAWWHEGDSELSDADLNAYIQYVVDDFVSAHR